MRGLSVVRLVLVSGLVTLGIAGTVLAGHLPAASYTGCLNVRSGALYDFAAGDTPLRACKSGDVEVHASGGDITAVTAGAGLVGGGASGGVSLAVDYAVLDARYQAAGSKATDADLLDGFDSSALQARVNGTCALGSSIRSISVDGTVLCEADNDTTYTAGAGLALAAGTFSVATGGVSNAMLQEGSVTNNKLSSAGSSSGQVLTSTGTGVAWGTLVVNYRSEQSTGFVRAFCEPGEKVLGGGGFVSGTGALKHNHPVLDTTGVVASGTFAIGWQIASSNSSDTVQAQVVCGKFG